MPKKPDIVLSGINFGYNSATDIQYSGTCGAAFEAAFQGYSAIAISEGLGDHAVTNANLHALLYNDSLQATADIRAREAAQKFSHTRPDGTECYTVFPEDYNTAGENLLMSDNEIATPKNMVNTWMASQGHKDNILAQRYTDTAIGIYQTETTTFVAQVFIG